MAEGKDTNAWTMFQMAYSTLALIFSIILIMGLIFTEQTKLAADVHPALAFFVLVGSITWLTMVEGGQGSLVGLAPVHFDLYKDTHKLSYESTKWCHVGDNLDRYLMGRQFMVVLIVFCVNMSGVSISLENGHYVGPLPSHHLNHAHVILSPSFSTFPHCRHLLLMLSSGDFLIGCSE